GGLHGREPSGAQRRDRRLTRHRSQPRRHLGGGLFGEAPPPAALDVLIRARRAVATPWAEAAPGGASGHHGTGAVGLLRNADPWQAASPSRLASSGVRPPPRTRSKAAAATTNGGRGSRRAATSGMASFPGSPATT